MVKQKDILQDGTNQNITLTTLKVGKQLNQTTQRKHQQYTIGTAQLGCPIGGHNAKKVNLAH